MPLGGLLPYGDEEERGQPSLSPDVLAQLMQALKAREGGGVGPGQFQAGGGLDNPFPNVDMLTDPSGARLQMLGTPPGGPVGPEQGPQESDLAKVLTWLSKSKRR